MFILPFLHYLKPHRLRLFLALVGMFFVSFFGTANILILMPFIRVMMNQPAVMQGRQQAEPAPPAATSVSEELARDRAARHKADKPKAGNFLPSISVREWIPESIRERADRLRSDWEDWYAEQARANPYKILLVMCAILLGMTTIKAVGEIITEYQFSYVFFFITLKMREDIYRRVFQQDYLFFVRKSPGYLSSRINSDVNDIKSIISKILLDGIQEPLNLLMSSIALIYISPQLTLVTVVLLPPIGIMLYAFSKTLRNNMRQQKKKSDKLTHTLTEALHNARLIKAFGTEDLEAQKFVKRSRDLFRYTMNRRIAKFASGPIMELFGTLAICGVLLLGGYMILGREGFLGGTLTFDQFVVYLAVLSRFYRPLKALSATTIRYQTAKVSAERVQEMLKLTPQVLDRANALPLVALRKGIELRDVHMSYQDREILRGVSIEIPRGKVVALVGRSGSGKTTIANLVARLFDPEKGQVLIDGIDIRDYKISDLRRCLGIVTQQTVLFDETIAKNIVYGVALNGASPEAVSERMQQAARAANAEEFILQLDGGKTYQTKIGPGGAKLSGGQSQRIAIARALFRDPQIMIFDEATSALDTHSQAQVQEAINKVLEHRTALVISHRLSTVRSADIIYVLEDGRVVEKGSHADLMALGGAYFRLTQAEERGEKIA